MRRAKDNRQVPKRYYRPERTHWPRCRHIVKRAYPLWRKYLVWLRGRLRGISVGDWCRNPQCLAAKRKRMFAARAAAALTVRGSSFAVAVLVQSGYWRFWKCWTVAEIPAVLTQESPWPISEREGRYLLGVFVVVVPCPYHLRFEEHPPYCRRHGLLLTLAARKPETGTLALYGVREVKFGLVLQVTPLLSAAPPTLAQRVLRPVKDLG